MGMTALGYRLPELAAHETRTLTVQGRPDLPDGEYGFSEIYCSDANCDCQRVLIQVLEVSTGPKIWATINFGWEGVAFYLKKVGIPELAEQASGAQLDPINPQSEYADVLLDYFVNMVADEGYIERLKTHYRLFRAAAPHGLEARDSKWRPPRKMKRRLR